METSFGANTPGSNPDTLRRWAKLNAPDLPQTALRLEEAADEIERLRNVICDYLGCDRHSAALAGNHDYRCPRSEHYRG